MEEGVGVGEGVEAGEDITLSLCVPCECLSFRLRNLLIVLMLGQVRQNKVRGSRLGCMYSDCCLTILMNRLWDEHAGATDGEQ